MRILPRTGNPPGGGPNESTVRYFCRKKRGGGRIYRPLGNIELYMGGGVIFLEGTDILRRFGDGPLVGGFRGLMVMGREDKGYV